MINWITAYEDSIERQSDILGFLTIKKTPEVNRDKFLGYLGLLIFT